MTQLKKIVVGLDFSAASKPALEQAMALAEHHGAQLVVAHASGLTDASMAMHDEAVRIGAPWKSYVEDRMQRAQQLLDEATESCRREGVSASARLSHAHADAALVSVAHDVDADLVVVGAHNRDVTDRWLLGSVSERVVRMCERNVLVARAATPARGALERVLIATDFSPTAERGLRVGLGLCSPEADVEVLHCWEAPVHYGLPPPNDLQRGLRERAFEQGNQLLAQLSVRVKRMHFEILDAPAADGILERLEAGEHEIVVIGSHGRRGVRRLLLGSVAERVVQRARHSVLVVHGP